ncbi:Ribonuclease H-like protein [Penicillium capsulatum]|uniref:Ribonuclease H-like protein n=1 Tax=Penicillium capsulatum TaxID=69766 RepID=A0A9W9IUD4_9EURO|nr:Ribonuclease H-like protein [Penicillium capsulatum]KAJ6129145.1 Ribonuclease H-like protein [Penicillium capsulatum]
MPSGQVFLGTLRNLQKLTDRGADVEFRWFPAHSDVWGKETVDQLAKEATTASAGEPSSFPPFRQACSSIGDQSLCHHWPAP